MEGYDALVRYMEAIKRMERAAEAKSRHRAKMTGRGVMSPRAVDVRNSKNRSSLEDMQIKMDKLEKKYDDKVLAWAEAQAAAITYLETLKEPEATILYHRYIKGLKWGDVASRVGYSVSSCRDYERAARIR